MQVWNVLHAARWNTGCKKIAKNSPPEHHLTNLSGCIFATKVCIDNRQKLVKQQYLVHMSARYGELRPISGWDRFTSLGRPSKFQWVSRVGFVTAATSLNGGQLNFAQCLAVSSYIYTSVYIFGALAPNAVLQRAKFTLRPSIAFSYIGSVNARHSSIVDVSQTLRRWAEGATYIRQGGHHVGHRPTF